MSCYDCPAAEIIPKPEDHGYYSIYGYCHKKAGEAYPIYIPDGTCPDRKSERSAP